MLLKIDLIQGNLLQKNVNSWKMGKEAPYF